ncbi:MAG: caspase family protein, partial [Spirochaetota bacterium]
KDFLRSAKPDDTLVLFVSGHGVQAGSPLNYYYITADTRLDDVPGTAAEFDQIESILQGVQPRTKLFLIDTCESGESDDAAHKTAVSSLAKGLSARTLDAAGIRAISVNRKTAPRRVVQTDRWIYNDLLRRSGAIVLSSCRADESSLESDQWQQGIFTRSVINALRSRAADRDGNGIVSTDELRSHVMKEVPELVKSLDPKAEQHPTVDRDNIHVRFGFPVIAAP